MKCTPKWIIALIILSFSITLDAMSQTMPFEEYDPPSTLVVPENIVTRAKYPFIDVHNHQFEMPTQNLNEVTVEMDKLNMAVMVNLSGRGFTRIEKNDSTIEYKLHGGDFFKKAVDNAYRSSPGRFIIFTNIDFDGIGKPDWTANAVKQLESDFQNGAKGLKIYKNLGLDITDSNGKRVSVDDIRIDPIWEKCGELGLPVLIHSGDPAPFWQPKDKYNERWFELKQKPKRYRDPEKNPSWEAVIAEQHQLFRKHPKTIFINAHLGWMGNDLARLGKLLDEMPNVYSEIGAVLAELGRQPRFARQWFIKYQDRILFGKDAWVPKEYHVYFRVLETNDEYFSYYRKRHAFWKIYGLGLPDDVLKKLYYKNALKIIPGIDTSRFPD